MKFDRVSIVVLFLLSTYMATSCNQDKIYTPKPRIFPKVEYPEKNYIPFTESACPFTFERPIYTLLVKDKQFFGEQPPNPCWFDLEFNDFNASLFFSYVDLKEGEDYNDLIADSYEIASQINLRSDFMQELPFKNKNTGVGGLVFEFQGAAASPLHFFVTDSTRHFLKGALYFETQARPDSLAPVIEFLKEDVYKLLETFSWDSDS